MCFDLAVLVVRLYQKTVYQGTIFQSFHPMAEGDTEKSHSQSNMIWAEVYLELLILRGFEVGRRKY